MFLQTQLIDPMLNMPIFEALLLSMTLLTCHEYHPACTCHMLDTLQLSIHTALVSVPTGFPKWHECLFQYTGLMVW
jgi:hypothetical protein